MRIYIEDVMWLDEDQLHIKVESQDYAEELAHCLSIRERDPHREAARNCIGTLLAAGNWLWETDKERYADLYWAETGYPYLFQDPLELTDEQVLAVQCWQELVFDVGWEEAL